MSCICAQECANSCVCVFLQCCDASIFPSIFPLKLLFLESWKASVNLCKKQKLIHLSFIHTWFTFINMHKWKRYYERFESFTQFILGSRGKAFSRWLEVFFRKLPFFFLSLFLRFLSIGNAKNPRIFCLPSRAIYQSNQLDLWPCR